MNIYKATLLLFPVILTGCSSADDKIVDLAGSVFAIFGALIIVKHQTPRVVNSQIFINALELFERHLKTIIYTLYLISATLVVIGVSLSGIHRVLIFMGMVLAIIVSNLNKMAQTKETEQRKLPMEIASLGVGMLVVLFMLWFFGTEMFNAF